MVNGHETIPQFHKYRGSYCIQNWLKFVFMSSVPGSSASYLSVLPRLLAVVVFFVLLCLCVVTSLLTHTLGVLRTLTTAGLS